MPGRKARHIGVYGMTGTQQEVEPQDHMWLASSTRMDVDRGAPGRSNAVTYVGPVMIQVKKPEGTGGAACGKLIAMLSLHMQLARGCLS